MASRYINADNFEIQVRNFFSSMLDAIESHHPFNRIIVLSKNNIVGLRLLEFSNFDSRLHDGDEIRPSYRYTYRLNGRYALTVSGEYSNDCFTVLLMITDRQENARFGFTVKVGAKPQRTKTLHIIAKIPIFGIHCVINYNPDTNYCVFSICPPLSNDDLDVEKYYATGNECALICLDLDFVGGSVSYEVYNYGNESPFYRVEPTTNSSNINEVAYEHCVANLKLDQSCEILIDPAIASCISKAAKSVEKSGTLTCENFGGVKGLNLSCTYGKLSDAKKGKFNAESLSYGASYTIGSDESSFDLTVGGEYSDKSLTVPVMITDKESGFAFGIELKLSGKSDERGLYSVVKVPSFNTEYVIKVKVNSDDENLNSVFIRSLKDDDDNYDKENAAAHCCDFIRLTLDTPSQKITHEVYEYETIKHFAKEVEDTNDVFEVIDQVKKISILGIFKKLVNVAANMVTHKVEGFIETAKIVGTGTKKHLPYIVGGACVLGISAVLIAIPVMIPVTIPAYAYAFAPVMIAAAPR